jgi:hypothetical protein
VDLDLLWVEARPCPSSARLEWSWCRVACQGRAEWQLNLGAEKEKEKEKKERRQPERRKQRQRASTSEEEGEEEEEEEEEEGEEEGEEEEGELARLVGLAQPDWLGGSRETVKRLLFGGLVGLVGVGPERRFFFGFSRITFTYMLCTYIRVCVVHMYEVKGNRESREQ